MNRLYTAPQRLATTVQVRAVQQAGQVVYEPLNPRARTFATLIHGDPNAPLSWEHLLLMHDELGEDIHTRGTMDDRRYVAYSRPQLVAPVHIDDHG